MPGGVGLDEGGSTMGDGGIRVGFEEAKSIFAECDLLGGGAVGVVYREFVVWLQRRRSFVNPIARGGRHVPRGGLRPEALGLEESYGA